MTVITRFFSRWWVVIGVIAAWQLAVIVFNINPFLIPGPIAIVTEVVSQPADFLLPLLLTLRTAIIGLTLGVGIGYLMASLAWLWPIFGATLTPFALVIRSVPFVALIPVLTRLLGYADHTAWIICAMVCFFPTFVLVGTGLGDIPPNGKELFASAGASRLDHYRLLAVPASLIGLATSVRIAASSSFAAALIAEFLMGTPGLAFVLSESLAQLDMTMLWGASMCSIVVSIAAYLAASGAEKRVISRWS